MTEEEAIANASIGSGFLDENYDSNNDASETSSGSSDDVSEEELRVYILDPEIYLEVEPTIDEPYIAKSYRGQHTPNGLMVDRKDYEQSKTDGYFFPLITLNGHGIDENVIEYLEIKTEDFLPTVELQINDIGSRITWMLKIGANNKLIVVITEPIDGAYKNIKLEFYCTSCDSTANGQNASISLHGVAKVFPLEQIGNKMYGKLTTFQLLKQICEETGYGLATDSNVKTITDYNVRNKLGYQNYLDFIKQQVKIGGTDSTEILDCWMDFYNTITLVNKYWLFNTNFQGASLINYAIVGLPTGQSETDINLNPQVVEVPRIITNDRESAGNINLVINGFPSYKTDNNSYKYEGTTNSYYISSPNSNNGGGMETKDSQTQELSIDGIMTGDYPFQKTKDLGTEMSEDTPILYQTAIRKQTLAKYNARKCEVQMVKPNFGLMRGQLVAMVISDYDPENKKNSVNSVNNSQLETAANNYMPSKQALTQQQKQWHADPKKPGYDPYGTGVFYIESVRFTYQAGNELMTQYLTLLKLGDVSSLGNIKTIPQVGGSYTGSDEEETSNEDNENTTDDEFIDNTSYDVGNENTTDNEFVNNTSYGVVNYDTGESVFNS